MTQRLITLAVLAALMGVAGCTTPMTSEDGAMTSSAAMDDNDDSSDDGSDDGAEEAEDVPVTGAYKGGLRHERTTTIGKV